ncbi:MAG: hypothetical protein VCA36_01855, partial [Opitutales bacterium]
EENTAPETLVTKAYQRALSRSPTEDELARAMKFHQEALALKGDETATDALAHLCHALFASAEFRYLD